MSELVDVITSTYRAGQFLEGFFQNLSSQTVFHRCHLVLRMNSPDAEEIRMAEAFRRRFPDQVRLSVCRGVETLGASWNKAINYSSSNFVTIWNVDDRRTADSIEHSMEALKSNPEASFVFGSFMIENPRRFFRKHRQVVSSSPSESELFTGMAIGPFFMFRREIFDVVGPFDEQYKTAADYDFAMRLVRLARGIHVPKVLGSFLDLGKGLSTNGSMLQPIERTAVELRYGFYPKIKGRYLKSAIMYDELYLDAGGVKIPVTRFLPSLEDEKSSLRSAELESLEGNQRRQGLRNAVFRLKDYVDNFK